MHRLGVVSFLNSQPLVAGLTEREDVHLTYAPPAELPGLLAAGAVDIALLPVVDILASDGRYRIVSNACIGCDGETMTVRVFSQVAPSRISTLHADVHSHTSVALARILWRDLFGYVPQITPFDTRSAAADHCESVLLIGDKVVDPQRGGFAFEVDLGGVWKQQTGLPFVFAAWAAPLARDDARCRAIATLLETARDRGVALAADIAAREGPRRGWSAALAERYLARRLRYRLDPQLQAGLERFAERCRQEGLLPATPSA